MSYMDHSPIRIVSRPKTTGFGEHWGVQLACGNVVHLTQNGERFVRFDEFAQNLPVKEIRRASPDQSAQIMQRVIQSLHQPGKYHLLDRNCETYATWVMGEKPQSPQVQGIIALGLIFPFLKFA